MAATNNNSVIQTTTLSPTPAASKPQSGWDPFEVWRTRVLLPRLAEERADKAVAGQALTVKIVRS